MKNALIALIRFLRNIFLNAKTVEIKSVPSVSKNVDVKNVTGDIKMEIRKMESLQILPILEIYNLRKYWNTERQWEGIVIHHSQTKDSQTVNWTEIFKYHTEVNGWQDIGYNFGIEKRDMEYVFCIGRSLNIAGAHTKGFNSTHLGICLVGNFDIAPPSEDQLVMLTDLVTQIIAITGITRQQVIAHWESFIPRGLAKNQEEAQAIKSCSGLQFSIEEFRKRLEV
jgi:hypothetical protein